MADRKRVTAPSGQDMDRIRRAKSLVSERLLRIPGVHSVGIGYKQVRGKVTDQLAVLVYVDEKLPRAKVEPPRMIPPDVRFFWDRTDREEIVPTDVIQRGRPVEYPHIADGDLVLRVRPVPGGYGITTPTTGGTLGGWVWDDINDQTVLISNHHVLGGTAGTDVFQPWDSTAAGDRIADVVRTGTLDATIAAPIDSTIALAEIAGIGPAVYEIAEATLGMAVEKSGATTEHTTGTVTAVDICCRYGGTYFDISRDAGIDRFAYYGDSGSFIVERTHPDGANWKRVVGLLWGGVPADRNGFAHQMTDVFTDLGLKTICAGILEEIFDSISFAAPAEMSREVPPPARREFQKEKMRAAERRPAKRGFARDIEGRLAASARGKKVVDLVHRNRAGLVMQMLNREVRRAAEAALMPFVGDAWTSDEVFDRPITAADVERFRRLHKIMSRRQPAMKDFLSAVDSLLKNAEGRSLSQILE